MNWEEEQQNLMREARLLSSNPEAVVEELKALSARTRAQPWWNSYGDKYEISLFNRNERLINLGLAAYGTNKEVLKALYKHGLEPAEDASDATYKEGLRIGSLSNSTAPEASIIFNFPQDIVGAEETQRVLTEATGNEIAALIQNPKVSDDLLEMLFKRGGVFAEIAEDRWQQLIYMSALNARLVTEYENPDSPDVGHYAIHKAIFLLLEIAPVNYIWLRTLYHLLDHLDFQQVHSAERIDQVLARWTQLPISEKDSGYFTTLSIRVEFRCFIAALYGRGFANNKTVLHGNRDADDVALRCAYYATGNITPKEMEAGHRKDKGVFTFAAILNSRIHETGQLRKIMEEEYLDGDMARRWLKYDEQFRKRRPNWAPPVSEELLADIATKPIDPVRLSITELQKALTALTTRVSELRQIMIVAAIALAILIYFRFK
jgi:hypothetical protein